MAGKTRTVADLMEDDQPLVAQQTGADEIIDLEMDKYTRMMNDCAGVTDGEIVFWLHRASEKNKALHATFLKRYPKETSFAEIFEEARDVYGSGDYVLLAKKDEVMFRKMSFTTERQKVAEAPPPEPKIDPLEKLSVAMERLAVVDKVSRIINDSREKPVPPGVDPTVQLMMTMMQGVMQQNTALLQGIMTQKRESPGGNDSLLEAIKLGSALAGGKLPMEEGEGGVMELLKGLAPYVPQIIASLTGRGGAPVPRPVAPGSPRPAIAGAVPVPTPAPVAAPAGVPPAEDARAMVMSRIVEEIKFILTLPASPKLYDHVINYIDSYMPDLLRQAEVVEGETFASYVVTLDPSFSGNKQFFLDLHKHYMEGMEEVGPDDPVNYVEQFYAKKPEPEPEKKKDTF